MRQLTSSMGNTQYAHEVVKGEKEMPVIEKISKEDVNQLLLNAIKTSIEASKSPSDLECLSRALERVGLRP